MLSYILPYSLQQSDKCGTPVVQPTYLFSNAKFLPADLADIALVTNTLNPHEVCGLTPPNSFIIRF